jgi:hypothetical protein
MKTANPYPFIIAAVIVAAGAYWFFSMRSDNALPLTADTQENVAQTRFKVLVSQLAGITFDTKLFSDSRFMGLIDLSTPVEPETSGRLDPFAPIPGVSEK